MIIGGRRDADGMRPAGQCARTERPWNARSHRGRHVIELDDLPAVLRGDYASLGTVAPAHRQPARFEPLRPACPDRCGRQREARVLDISYHTLQFTCASRHEPARPAKAWSGWLKPRS